MFVCNKGPPVLSVAVLSIRGLCYHFNFLFALVIVFEQFVLLLHPDLMTLFGNRSPLLIFGHIWRETGCGHHTGALNPPSES